MTTPSASTTRPRAERPDFRLLCCLCRKPIPRSSDVYALDEEWQRRYPQMVGTLACSNCAIRDHYWDCQTRVGAYVPGHRPVDPRKPSDVDSWSHIREQGTQVAMMWLYPWSAVQQGAADYLRWVLVDRQRLEPELAHGIREALHHWDNERPSS